MTELRVNGVVEMVRRRRAIDGRVDIYDDIVDFGSAQEYRRNY